jgi:hypothetical protein
MALMPHTGITITAITIITEADITETVMQDMIVTETDTGMVTETQMVL